MPFFVRTFLLYVPPHQRQLAYNSTAHGRSQHISAVFSKVGHLPFFAAIVWIVPIICAILVFRACVRNLLYIKRNRSLLLWQLTVRYLHFASVLSRSLPTPIKAGRFPLAQNSQNSVAYWIACRRRSLRFRISTLNIYIQCTPVHTMYNSQSTHLILYHYPICIYETWFHSLNETSWNQNSKARQ